MRPNRKLRLRTWMIPLFTALLVIAVSLFTLFAGGNAGLSDNGDFARVMKVNRIYQSEDGRHSFQFQQYYKMEIEGENTLKQIASLFATQYEDELYSSPQFVFIKLSKVANYLYNHVKGNPLDSYDLAFLAFLYIALFAAAVFLILYHLPKSTWRRQLLTAGMILFLFCDAGYILYFHSFYGEPLQFVSLMLAAGALLRLYQRPERIGTWLLLFVSLYFFAGSKLANIPVAILFALGSLLLAGTSKKIVKALAVCLCGIFLVSNLFLYQSIPDWMDYDTNYQAVFYGILKDSTTPEADLADLELPEEYKALAGTHAYQEQYPLDVHAEDFREGFYQKISKMDVVKFYILHPVRLLGEMETALQCSAYIRPPYLGNLSSEPMEFISRWSGWSFLRANMGILYQMVLIFPALLILTILFLWKTILHLKQHSRLAARNGLVLCLCGAIWMSWLLPIVGNGEADLAKHMFLFIHLMDLLLAACIAACIYKLPDAVRFFAGNRRRTAALLSTCVVVFAVCLTVYALSQPEEMIFGTWRGEPLKWQIVEEKESTLTLVCSEGIGATQFDAGGFNLWSESSLRSWLNNGFLNAFSESERQRLQPITHKEFLSQPNAYLAQEGYRPYYWQFDPGKLGSNTDGTYYRECVDTVMIPSYDCGKWNKSSIGKTGKAYWLLVPYSANGEMQWMVGQDGYILFRDAAKTANVCPVIRIVK